MAGLNLPASRNDVFPEGTVVSARRASQVARHDDRNGQVPGPAAVASGTVTAGALALTGLDASTPHVLSAVIGVPVTGAAATDKITVNGPGFSNGDVIQFGSLTGGAGLTANTPYVVRDAEAGGKTFKVAVFDPSSGNRPGAAVDITSDLTAGTIKQFRSIHAVSEAT
jgi:hypothetical protein